MPPFRRSQSRQWGGAPRLLYRRGQIDDGAAPRWFHGFDGAGLWYRRRASGHDTDGTVVDALIKIDGDTIILKRRASQARKYSQLAKLGLQTGIDTAITRSS